MATATGLSNNNPAFAFAASLLPPGIELPSSEAMKATDNVKPIIVQVNVAFLSLVGVTCLARVYVRLCMVRNFGWDDALNYGFGQHIWMLDLLKAIPMTMRVIKDLFVFGLMYSTAMTFVKLSIIISYLRLFPISTFRRFLHILTFIILSLWFCSIWVMMFQCRPIRGAWDFTVTKRKCIQIVNYIYFSSGVNIATDVALCTVPLPLLLKMRLPTRQKVGVCVLFAVGGFACVASILRLSQIHNLIGFDVTYTSTSSVNWSVVETGTSIVCASIPCLKPLWVLVLPQRWRSTNFTTAHTGSGDVNRNTPTWGSGSQARKGSKLGSGFSRSRSNEEEDLPLHRLADEERGIKKTTTVTTTVDVAEVDSSPAPAFPTSGRTAPVVYARAYSREAEREARTTWVDSAEELVGAGEIVREGSRQGCRGNSGLTVPKSVYAR